MRYGFPFLLFIFLLSVSCVSSPDKKAIAAEYASIGDAYMDVKKYDQAETAYRKALDYDPGISLNAYNLARSYAENGSFDKAIAIIDSLLAKDSENVIVLSLKAYALLKAEKPEEAGKVYGRVLDLEPYSLDALFNDGLIQRALGNQEEAYERFDAYNSLKPKDEEGLKLLADACFATGRTDRGFELLETYTSLKAQDPEGFLAVAERRTEAREYAAAIEAYDAYLAIKADDALAWFEKARLELVAAHEGEKALESFKKAIGAGYSDKARAEALVAAADEGMREDFTKAGGDLLAEEPTATAGADQSMLPASPTPGPASP
jgi:tetratricopeptide (TPR) repeat protein